MNTIGLFRGLRRSVASSTHIISINNRNSSRIHMRNMGGGGDKITTPFFNSLLLSSIFDLENIARARGGDKYYCCIMNIELIIYIPQTISRFINNTKIDSPHEKIKISVFSGNKEIYTESEGIIGKTCECQLERAAAKSGGDRYSGEINGEIFTFY